MRNDNICLLLSWWCLFGKFTESIEINGRIIIEEIIKYLLSSETFVADFKIIFPEIIAVSFDE